MPFFFKQWGGVQKSRAGRLLEGRTYDEFPAGGDDLDLCVVVTAPTKLN